MAPDSSRRRALVGVVLTIFIWSLVGFAWLQHQEIYDWWRMRDYTPPSEIVQLADDTTMNDGTRRVFYVTHPLVEGRESFNGHCSDGEFTIVLGCYISRQGIYLYKVDDARLAGVEQVTAAHETLHAAYDRLSSKERSQVNEWTAAAFADLNNQRIKDTIEQYRSKDPSSVPNELHSILGTEVRNLPPELENYYKRYFVNRSKIVDFSDQYEGAFSSRQAQIAAYEAELKPLGEEIKKSNEELKSESERIQNQYSQLESQRSNADPAKFNVEVEDYNRAVRSYNQKVAKTSSMIDRYNSIYDKYKAIVIEQQALSNAIDSRPQTIKTQ